MYDLIADVEALSGVKRYNIDKLIDLALYSISHDVIESKLSGSNSCTIDIGIGYLYFEYEDNIIKYKFTPNEKFEKNLQLSYKGVDRLDKKLDENLGQRISSTYKELFQ